MTVQDQLTNHVIYSGDGVSGIYVWGEQFVQGTWQGPYQVTTSAAVNNGVIRSLAGTRLHA